MALCRRLVAQARSISACSTPSSWSSLLVTGRKSAWSLELARRVSQLVKSNDKRAFLNDTLAENGSNDFNSSSEAPWSHLPPTLLHRTSPLQAPFFFHLLAPPSATLAYTRTPRGVLVQRVPHEPNIPVPHRTQKPEWVNPLQDAIFRDPLVRIIGAHLVPLVRQSDDDGKLLFLGGEATVLGT